ncbi:MAG: PTS lactose transporter subunit IIB [bacterium]|nr:PTS lactose transporter subunit IIB [bacterium]MCY3579870.1 PTS lactose transporter subunit IIB [bacterium]MCY3651641.1 PTS lactose transporter subunit IIB [bacterium]MDE0643965.1 PTS lactose transporter subunit IIB [bacterium]
MGSTVKKASEVQLIVLACEAGMGSSLMVANGLKKKVKKAKLGIKVTHSPVHSIPADADVVVTHEGLSARVRETAPPGSPVVTYRVFLNDPAITNLVDTLAAGGDVEGL